MSGRWTKATIFRRILLVRHGHYQRTGGLGDSMWGLSPLGRRQSVRVGRRLNRVLDPGFGRFDGLYSSPWPRASQTAEVAAREMDLAAVKVKPYLHEVIPIVDPGLTATRLFPFGLPPTAPEDREAAAAQIETVRTRFFRPPKRPRQVVLFTHGNLIRYLVTGVLGLPYEAWAFMDIAHCGVSEIRIYANGFEALVCFNETGHLPPSMITTA
jgi:broad specificity phosphatase PhoE